MTYVHQPFVWCWWDRDEPEDGLLGFHTKSDRDRFSSGKPGPFRRRIAKDGHTISQTRNYWDDLIAEAREKLGEKPRDGLQ